MKKNNKTKDLLYPYTPERQLVQPSGFCMTKDHDGCRYQFNHGKCGCECHKIKSDPRPWRTNE